ncbi:MAG: ABC transporter substrate-binding protein [Candidatus Rokuibacteriota bacterium]|nr:MAG: ABC transporter substrate-binding protein [Candidatus Rokubacteria bacterium]
MTMRSPRGRSLGAMLAAVLLLAGPARAADDVVNVIHYGGSFGKALREAFFDPAEKALNIRVNDMSRTDMAKIKAMVQSGKLEWDVANVNTLEVWRGVKEGLWEPIDYGIVDRSVVGPAKEYEYGVPFIGIATGLIYSTKKYPSPDKAPQSWADFWDVKRFPGPRSLENRVRYTLTFALLADGVPPDKLYPLDVERAFRKLDQIKPHITVWSKPPVQALELIASGEVVMALTPNNEWAEAARRGVPVGWQWNQAIYTTNAWTVLKGTPNKRAAMLLIREMSRPQLQARLAELTYFGPMNPKALPLVPAQVRQYLPTEPENLKKAAPFDHEWWGAHEAELIERWNAWLIK